MAPRLHPQLKTTMKTEQAKTCNRILAGCIKATGDLSFNAYLLETAISKTIGIKGLLAQLAPVSNDQDTAVRDAKRELENAILHLADAIGHECKGLFQLTAKERDILTERDSDGDGKKEFISMISKVAAYAFPDKDRTFDKEIPLSEGKKATAFYVDRNKSVRVRVADPSGTDLYPTLGSLPEDDAYAVARAINLCAFKPVN